mmetsp:Transcript_33674/g.70794  ORF Transcript_33674/g.70794 Transcript_33674/m.70794 type:complete len:102 (-) Transcript_33674:538-843(-)
MQMFRLDFSYFDLSSAQFYSSLIGRCDFTFYTCRFIPTELIPNSTYKNDIPVSETCARVDLYFSPILYIFPSMNDISGRPYYELLPNCPFQSPESWLLLPP